MSQFGPALKWPWTKLVAPELTEELLEKIVAQSDEQARKGGHIPAAGSKGSETQELMRLRDQCLVAVLKGLGGVGRVSSTSAKEEGYGAGRVLNEYTQALLLKAKMEETRRGEEPLETKPEEKLEEASDSKVSRDSSSKASTKCDPSSSGGRPETSLSASSSDDKTSSAVESEKSHHSWVKVEDVKGEKSPLLTHHAKVLPQWIDYNGHMTESRYLEVFGEASDALLERIGMTKEYVQEKKRSYYTVETHIMNKKEVTVGEDLRVSTQILKVDGKRLHLFHRLEASPPPVNNTESGIHLKQTIVD